MSSESYNYVEHHIIRNKPKFFVDTLEIIPYSKSILISWNLIMSTQNILTDILGEEFNDLLMTINLWRVDEYTNMKIFYINEYSGTLQMNLLPNGYYYCELIASNSQNETISIKKSKSIQITHSSIKLCNENWTKRPISNKNLWSTAFSGYSVYE